MDNNSPISNIPQLFTHYRAKILEESGQAWFHLDNHASPEAIVPPAQTSPIEAPSSSITMGTNIGPSLTDTRSTDQTNPTLPPQETVSRSPSEPAVKIYEYPDPWTTPKEGISASSPNVSSGWSESSQIQTRAEDALAPEPTVPVNQAPSHPSHNVNLFPLGDTTQDTRHSLYDLTEFDNGEIEVPPIASRDLQQAKFEKIDPIQSTSSDTLSVRFDSTAPSNPTLNFRKAINSKTASAEIAKFRLRNCL